MHDQMPFAYSHNDIQYGMVYLEDDSLYVGAVGSLKRDDAFVQPSEGNMKAEDDAMQGRTIAAEQYGYLEGSVSNDKADID